MYYVHSVTILYLLHTTNVKHINNKDTEHNPLIQYRNITISAYTVGTHGHGPLLCSAPIL